MTNLIYALCLLLPSLILISLAVIFLVQNFTSAPYVPSSAHKLVNVFEQLNLPRNATFLDLGSGDGRHVFAASQYFKAAHGVEVNPYLWVWSLLWHKLINRKPNVKFIRRSFFNLHLAPYSVVYIYLFPQLMAKLESKLFRELPKGSIIISHTFKFDQHEPTNRLSKHYWIYTV